MAGSLVLLSAGLDSTVNFKCALDREGVSMGLTFDYGQRAAEREMSAARAICQRYGVPHKRIDLAWLAEDSRAAVLKGRAPVPEPDAAQLDDAGGAAARSADAVWVPNRNGVFVNAAAAVAERMGISTVVVGFNAEEAATFPDNSSGFLDAANCALRFSTRGAVSLACYTIGMLKADIVRLGLEIEAPLDLVWPCYMDGPRMCGKCESCMRFLRAAAAAGAVDRLRCSHPGMPLGA